MRHLKGRLNSSSCPLRIFLGGDKALAEVIAEFIDAKRAAARREKICAFSHLCLVLFLFRGAQHRWKIEFR
jgi:hypothetical protein